jgi:hypothetical protein
MMAFLIPISTLVVVYLGAAFASAQGSQSMPRAGLPDLTVVSQVEIRAADGAVVLAGQFGAATTDNGETEREATLTAAGAITGAKGTAEIEWTTRGNQTEREFEVEVEGLPAGTPFSVVLDGQPVASFTTDADGEAEVELQDVT